MYLKELCTVPFRIQALFLHIKFLYNAMLKEKVRHLSLAVYLIFNQLSLSRQGSLAVPVVLYRVSSVPPLPQQETAGPLPRLQLGKPSPIQSNQEGDTGCR